MAIDPNFVDYYELLEASPNASVATIERAFRYLAKHHHPDSSEHGDIKVFTQLVEAYETLTDPCLLYTSPSPRDRTRSRMPSSA